MIQPADTSLNLGQNSGPDRKWGVKSETGGSLSTQSHSIISYIVSGASLTTPPICTICRIPDIYSAAPGANGSRTQGTLSRIISSNLFASNSIARFL